MGKKCTRRSVVSFVHGTASERVDVLGDVLWTLTVVAIDLDKEQNQWKVGRVRDSSYTRHHTRHALPDGEKSVDRWFLRSQTQGEKISVLKCLSMAHFFDYQKGHQRPRAHSCVFGEVGGSVVCPIPNPGGSILQLPCCSRIK